MPAYHRTQILLEPEQHIALVNFATEEERSLSDIFREMAARFIAEKNTEGKKKKALAAIGRLADMRKKMAARRSSPMLDPVTLLNEMREERMADFERIWRGEE